MEDLEKIKELNELEDRELLIIDASVLAYQIAYDSLLTRYLLIDKEKALGLIWAQLGYISGGEWGDFELDKLNVVWALDCKDSKGAYWRHDYLRPLGIEYKGGRNRKSSTVLTVFDILEPFLKASNEGVAKKIGYEADDIISATVRKFSPYFRRTTILTIDSDLSGMVTDKSLPKEVPGNVGNNVRWVSSNSRYKPVVRDSLHTLNIWSKSRLNVELNYPAQIWEYKSQYGDVSDNLPPNSPLEVIDLYKPPIEFDLKEDLEFMKRLEEAVKCKSNRERVKCRKHLIEAGMPFVLRPIGETQ